MAGPPVAIYDMMACNVYGDFENLEASAWPKRQHRFLVSFYPTADVPTPELIDEITVLGPDGYTRGITNQPFTEQNRDGWTYQPAVNNYLYLVNVPTGYLADGEYTIEVALKDGDVLSQSRFQQDDVGAKMVPVYLEHRERILSSFVPSIARPLPANLPLSGITCSWSTLSDVGGIEAYYILRLSELPSGKAIWWDDIFLQRDQGTDLMAGLDRSTVGIRAELKPRTRYAYSVEIADANALCETNIAILQPYQYFTTP